MGDGCQASECKFKCTEKLSHDFRQKIFDQFYIEDFNDQAKVRIDYKNYKYHNP